MPKAADAPVGGRKFYMAALHRILDAPLRVHYLVKREGFSTACRYLFVFIRRYHPGTRYAVFCKILCDTMSTAVDSSDYCVERVDAMESLSADDLRMLGFNRRKHNLTRKMQKRFGQGASIWILRERSSLVGFTWSLCGRSVKPHFLPMMEKDVLLFDNEILQPFRAKGLNTILLIHISRCLSHSGHQRIYACTGVWNMPEKRSLAKAGFLEIGVARCLEVFGLKTVVWGHQLGAI